MALKVILLFFAKEVLQFKEQKYADPYDNVWVKQFNRLHVR